MLTEIGENQQTETQDGHINDSDVQEPDDPMPDIAEILEKELNNYKDPRDGALVTYFSSIVDRIKNKDNGYPREYRRGTFWVEPKSSFFALREQNTLYVYTQLHFIIQGFFYGYRIF